MTALRCLHLCNGLDPTRDGGMVPSILGFTGALARRGLRTEIVTPNASRRSSFLVPDGVHLIGPHRDFAAHVERADIVHVHGLWQYQSRAGARWSRRLGVPYLITAHGMVDPWALRHKAWKKRTYLALVEARNLRCAACLHALARPEVEHFRAIAPRAVVALIPNGVDLEPFDALPDRAELESIHPGLRQKFLLLFMGRIHAKKGLDLLEAALKRSFAARDNLHLLLAGRDEGAERPFLQSMREAGFADRVTCFGHVAGSEAKALWGAADAFILPSHSEGFSMAVLEALAARLPVIVTTACNFPELERTRGGLVVAPTREDVGGGLMHLLDQSSAERRDMALRGRALVERDFSWPEQGRRMDEVYRWLAGGGPAPDFVVRGTKAPVRIGPF
jgi:glycosyltransferase involved in cell wall biosynthesis